VINEELEVTASVDGGGALDGDEGVGIFRW